MANDLKGANSVILSVVIVSVVFVIGIFILSQMETTFDSDNNSVVVANESGWVNSSGYTLQMNPLFTSNPNNFAIVRIINGSSGALLATTNYSLSSTTLKNASNAATIWVNANITYSYTYTNQTAASFAANQSVDALSDGTPWLTIIIVVAFAVIVLGFLTSGFNNAGRDNIVY